MLSVHVFCSQNPKYSKLLFQLLSMQQFAKQNQKFSLATLDFLKLLEILVAFARQVLQGYACRISTGMQPLNWSHLAVNFEPRDSFWDHSWCLFEAMPRPCPCKNGTHAFRAFGSGSKTSDRKFHSHSPQVPGPQLQSTLKRVAKPNAHPC